MMAATPYELPVISSPRRQVVTRSSGLGGDSDHLAAAVPPSASAGAFALSFGAATTPTKSGISYGRRKQTSPGSGWGARPLGAVAGVKGAPSSKSTPEEDTLAKIREEMAAQFRNRSTAQHREARNGSGGDGEGAEGGQNSEVSGLIAEGSETKSGRSDGAETDGAAGTFGSSSAPVLAPAPSTAASQFHLAATEADDGSEDRERDQDAAQAGGPSVRVSGAPSVTAEDVSRLREIALREATAGGAGKSRLTPRAEPVKMRGRPAKMKPVAQPAAPLTVREERT